MYHVANDSNYIMGIYVGADKKGKEKRTFELVNSLDAVKFYNSGLKEQNIDILPYEDKNGYALKWKLKIGSMVLLYEDTPSEIYDLDLKALSKRLYKSTIEPIFNFHFNAYPFLSS